MEYLFLFIFSCYFTLYITKRLFRKLDNYMMDRFVKNNYKYAGVTQLVE